MTKNTNKWILSTGAMVAVASPIAFVVACGSNSTNTKPEVTPPEVEISEDLQKAYDLIDGKSMLTDISRNGGFDYNHKDVITKLYEYRDYYEENYDISDLVVGYAGDYEVWKDKIDSTSNILLGSQGGPTRGVQDSYFDTSFDAGRVNSGNTTDVGFTTSIDFDGSSFYIAPEWYDLTTESDWHLINVVQAQVLHYLDDGASERFEEEIGSEDGWNTEYAFDMNLRTVAILEVVANYFDSINPASLNLTTHSFGSIMAPLWLGTFGWLDYQDSDNQKFDEIAIGAGRLQFNTEVIDMTSKGFMSSFALPYEEDGIWKQDFNYNEDDITQDQDMIDYVNSLIAEEDTDEYYWDDPVWQPGDTVEIIFNKLRSNFLMQNGFGALDYIALLDEYSGAYDNVTYIHGRTDVATGMLHQNERDAIDKHFKAEMFSETEGHSINFAFDVSVSNNIWRTFGIEKLRIV